MSTSSILWLYMYHVSRFFGSLDLPPPLRNHILVLKISKSCNFLTPLPQPSDYVIYEWSLMKRVSKKSTWRTQMETKAVMRNIGVLKVPFSQSMTWSASGALAKPCQKVKTAKVIEPRRDKTKRTSWNRYRGLAISVFSA